MSEGKKEASEGSNKMQPEEPKKTAQEITEIQEKTQKQLDDIRSEQKANNPLVTIKLDLDLLDHEFVDSPNFLAKIEKLKTLYQSYRGLRRDGSCFYRAFIFRVFEFVLENEASHPEVQKIVQAIESSQALMEENGFEKLVIEDFCELAKETLQNCLKKTYTEESLSDKFRDEEFSNSLVMFLRFLTSASLQKQKELYSVYLDESLTMDIFCRTEVEPIDVEADNVLYL